MGRINALASQVAERAGSFKNKTEEFIRSMDSKLEIERIENEIENLYMDIGEIICKYFDSGEKLSFNGDITEKYKRIKILQKGILNRKKVLSHNMRDTIYCENCGEIMQIGARYCPICGKKVMKIGRNKASCHICDNLPCSKGVLGLEINEVIRGITSLKL